MARTRAQNKGKKNQQERMKSEIRALDVPSKGKGQKRPRKDVDNKKADEVGQRDGESPAPKKAKTVEAKPMSQEDEAQKPPGIDPRKLEAILEAYGVLPLQDSGLINTEEASPNTILALVYNAMLTSARISHELAYRSVKCLLEAGYHDLEKMKNSTWQERTEVLTKGGYTRYREKTATALGELADFVDTQYDGDLNNLLKRAGSSPAKVRNLFQEIKGIGKVGTDIFFDSVQGVWPSLAPFIDPRSMDTAERCGVGNNIDAMWEAVGKDPIEMCKLSSALTTIRLEKKESEFK